jgi:hypothetical protein
MKEHLKAIVIVFIILIAYTIVVYVYADSKNKKKDKKEENKTVEPEKKDNDNKPDESETNNYDLNIVLFSKTIIGYKDGKWYENPSFNYNNVDFDFYTDGKKYPGMGLVYTDRWYVKSQDNSLMDYENGFLGINASTTYSVSQYKDQEISASDQAVIEDFLKSKGIKYNYQALKKYVMTSDLNRDGLHDNVYVLSNLFLRNYDSFDKTFAFVFVRSLNQNIVLFEDVYDGVDAVSICDPYFEGIVSVDNTNSVIVGCEYFSMGGTKYMVFGLDGKNGIKRLETKAN